VRRLYRIAGRSSPGDLPESITVFGIITLEDVIEELLQVWREGRPGKGCGCGGRGVRCKYAGRCQRQPCAWGFVHCHVLHRGSPQQLGSCATLCLGQEEIDDELPTLTRVTSAVGKVMTQQIGVQVLVTISNQSVLVYVGALSAAPFSVFTSEQCSCCCSLCSARHQEVQVHGATRSASSWEHLSSGWVLLSDPRTLH
jgi:hypothetical protein